MPAVCPPVCPPVFVPNSQDQWVQGMSYDGGSPMVMNAHPDNPMMFLPQSPTSPGMPFSPADRTMSPMHMQGSPMQGNSPHGNMMGMLMPIFPAIDEHGAPAMHANRFMPMGMAGQDGISTSSR